MAFSDVLSKSYFIGSTQNFILQDDRLLAAIQRDSFGGDYVVAHLRGKGFG